MTGLFKRLCDAARARLPYRRKRIDVVAWIPECPFTDALIAEIAKAKPNSLMLMHNRHSQRLAYVYRPPGISFHRDPFLSCLAGPAARLGYFFYPVYLMLNAPVIFFFYLWIGLRFRVRTVFMWDLQQCVIVGLLRRLRVFKRLVYFTGEWFPGNSFRRGVWSRIGNDVYFPIMDWIACKCSDLTINQTDVIAKARTQYWGRQIPHEEAEFEPPLIAKRKEASMGHKILFLGITRSDSGLDLVLKALPLVRERFGDVTLKIVGPMTPALEELKRVAVEYGVGPFLECVGFVDRGAFEAAVADCYCGVNLITDPHSHSSTALPAKLWDYVQNLLPVLVTAHVGEIVDTIREQKLGLLVTPDVEAVASSLIELHDRHSDYVRNIQTFLRTRSSTNLVQLLCPETSRN